MAFKTLWKRPATTDSQTELHGSPTPEAETGKPPQVESSIGKGNSVHKPALLAKSGGIGATGHCTDAVDAIVEEASVSPELAETTFNVVGREGESPARILPAAKAQGAEGQINAVLIRR